MSRVHVTLYPLGEYSAPDCAVDAFRTGIATVTSLYDGRIVNVFWPTQWVDASAVDARNNPMYSFPNTVLIDRLRAAGHFDRQQVA